MNEKKKIIALMGIAVGLGIASTLSLAFSINKEPVAEEQKTEVEEQLSELDEKITEGLGSEPLDESLPPGTIDISDLVDSDLTEEQILEIKRENLVARAENAPKLGDESLPELPVELGNQIYNGFINRIEVEDYVGIIDEIQALEQQYKMHEYRNWRFGFMKDDATVMKDRALMEEGRMEVAVGTFHDPVFLLLSTLRLTESERRSLIEDKQSLSPIFDGNILVSGVEVVNMRVDEEISDPHINSIKSLYSDLNEVHVIRFTIEGNQMVGYVAGLTGGRYRIHTIQADMGQSYHYQTIAWWEEFESNLID